MDRLRVAEIIKENVEIMSCFLTKEIYLSIADRIIAEEGKDKEYLDPEKAFCELKPQQPKLPIPLTYYATERVSQQQAQEITEKINEIIQYLMDKE